ncbi:hypothetical protein Q8A67_003072 [Cirrhinus molitorella]|uniref:Uncharacterized protein n=1 Tax=Cirrhinus molitorella TaxID=172907 RepID=A0AA88Q2H8_9TELE|nr:hypothetical protein Q8A67_003072 [Cirrhinus molitorella]
MSKARDGFCVDNDFIYSLRVKNTLSPVPKRGMQDLITQMRETLANVNKPPIADPTTKPTGVQVQEPSPQVQTYILNPLPAAGPPAEPNPAQQPSAPQINLYISGLPQQDRTTAAEPLKQAPLQQPVLANLESMPAMQSPAQAVALRSPYSSVLPQNSIILPLAMPSQMYPHIYGPLQSPAFLGPQVNPYIQAVNPLLGPQSVGPYPFYPQTYPLNPYMNYGMPNVAVSPPIIFRERGQTVTTQV